MSDGSISASLNSADIGASMTKILADLNKNYQQMLVAQTQSGADASSGKGWLGQFVGNLENDVGLTYAWQSISGIANANDDAKQSMLVSIHVLDGTDPEATIYQKALTGDRGAFAQWIDLAQSTSDAICACIGNNAKHDVNDFVVQVGAGAVANLEKWAKQAKDEVKEDLGFGLPLVAIGLVALAIIVVKV